VTDPRRGTFAYKQLRDRERAKRLPCWLCGGEIDHFAKHRSRLSFSLDHVIPLKHGGSVLDPENARSAHYGCNAARGARMARPRGTPSRDWNGKPKRRLPVW
jgi:5-methylcytosine-specific restriction endonuclease McrA